MTWLASIIIALLSAALGLFLAGMVAAACVSWYRISGFEGASGYFVVFTALLGGIAALIIGLVTCRVVAAGNAPGFFKGLGISFGIVGGIAGIAALVCWLLADIPPSIDGLSLDLAVEIRLPVGETESPARVTGDSSLSLGSVVNHVQRKSEKGELRTAEARREGGRWIIPGTVYLFTTRGQRAISAELGGKQVGGFLVPLPRNPGKEYEKWSDWLPRSLSGDQPWPDSKASYRFRVVRRLPPPPEPDPEVVEAEKFAALGPEAPLEAWLSYLQESAPAARTLAIMKIVEERPAELAQAIRGPDTSLRELALTSVTKLAQVAPEVSEAVRAEQSRIVEGIKRFNAMKSDDAGYYDLGNELRSRFSYWHRAWWTVHHKTGADGRPLLKEIHDLARVHPEDGFMQEIEVNARVHLEALERKSNQTP